MVPNVPEFTFAYFGIGEWDVAGLYEEAESSLAAVGADELVRDFEREIGIDVERDVVALLTGEIGFGLFPSTDGLIATSGAAPIGGLVLLHPGAHVGAWAECGWGLLPAQLQHQISCLAAARDAGQQDQP